MITIVDVYGNSFLVGPAEWSLWEEFHLIEKLLSEMKIAALYCTI